MRPYTQEKLPDGTIQREFNESVDSEELIWHQDKLRRKVKIVEGGDWKLQLERGLPFDMIVGETYEIPAKSWHRVLKGSGPLKVIIYEFD